MAADMTMAEMEEMLSTLVGNKLFGDLTEVVTDAGMLVFSVYRWATQRKLSAVFDYQEYKNDQVYAFEEVTQMFRNLDLGKIVDRLIEVQAEVIWHRRVSEGKNGGMKPSDRQEAKRYIAFLFFDDLLRLCRENHSCPRGMLASSEWSSLIVNLLKSLSIEDYCRIKAYLASIDRKQRGQGAPHYEYADFLNAMADLDNCLVNCGITEGHDTKIYEHFLDGNNRIQQAKMNRADTLGSISETTVSRFMDTYYGFLAGLGRGETKVEDASAALRELYRAGNTRIVNAAEYLLKCGISSLVPAEKQLAIRQDCFKPGLGCS
jgi:hypothetical protein